MEEESKHAKEYNDFTDWLTAGETLSRFQRIHNIIRPDFQLLLQLTEEQKTDEKKFDALYRACLTRFFTLIEADIYGLNRLDTYDGYDDKKDRFIEKFKETFKQICKTWDKEELQKKYFGSKLQGLIELKRKRDELVHPKKMEDIHKASDKDFQELREVFEDYDKFINDLMNGFWLRTKIDSSSFFGQR
jgi:hypothetical protein